MTDKHGMIWWSELHTRDPEAAKAYYGSICGWGIETVPMPDGSTYILCNAGETPTAGIFDMRDNPAMEGVPEHWFTYVAVADVDKAVAQGEAAGGKTIRPPFDVDGVGRIAIIHDVNGAAVGLMTPSDPPG